jgi:hypothetical protein
MRMGLSTDPFTDSPRPSRQAGSLVDTDDIVVFGAVCADEAAGLT